MEKKRIDRKWEENKIKTKKFWNKAKAILNSFFRIGYEPTLILIKKNLVFKYLVSYQIIFIQNLAQFYLDILFF